tara:strand:- start:305 stop:1345 length:1041 start_codon:yes stop_codon:yes gene_type:complete
MQEITDEEIEILKQIQNLSINEKNILNKLIDNNNSHKQLIIKEKKFKEYISNWIDLIINNNSKNYKDHKREAIVSIYEICNINNIDYKEFLTIIETFKKNEFIIEEGNIFNNIKDFMGNDYKNKYLDFFKNLSDTKPRGICGSPNADCGKWELLYRLMRPNAKKPKKGDIIDGGEIEIKGDDVRISHLSLEGIKYIKNTNAIFEKSSFNGNNTTTKKWKNKKVFEIEKPSYSKHYIEEFSKNIDEAKKCIKEYLLTHKFVKEQELSNSISNIFENNEYNVHELRKIILVNMYKKYKENKGFDKMIVFGNGTNVKIINNINDILDKFSITTDYFRIGQNCKIGLYIK